MILEIDGGHSGIRFSACHFIPHHDKCSRLHGHSYILRLRLEGDIGENGSVVKDYFAKNDAHCPENVNPAEFIIEVCSGSLSKGRDWGDVWLKSEEHTRVSNELDHIIKDAASKPPGTPEDPNEFAMPLGYQIKVVTKRAVKSVYRNTDYVNNKVMLHISCALFNG